MNYNKERIIYFSIIISTTLIVPVIAYFNMARHIENFTLLHFIMPLIVGFISSFGLANFYLLRITNKKLKKSEDELKQYAFFDKLTGLRNRLSLYDIIDNMILQSNRKNSLNGLVFMDLDGFKIINDNYGHSAGDHVLKIVSERMKELVRESDTVARQGGDEFVLLLTNLSSKSEVGPILDKLIKTVEEPIFFEGKKLEISISAGVSFCSAGESTDTDELISKADKAMYQAKIKGKGRYEFYA